MSVMSTGSDFLMYTKNHAFQDFPCVNCDIYLSSVLERVVSSLSVVPGCPDFRYNRCGM